LRAVRLPALPSFVVHCGPNDEQFTLDRLDGLAVRRINGVRVEVERRRNARVPELLLRDLHRHVEVVEQRRVNAAELMPRHTP